MRQLTYAAVLTGCLCAALPLELVLRTRVLARWRRLAAAVLPVAVVFLAWDVLAVRAGHWSYDPDQVVGLTLPGDLPVEEALFFLVVPTSAVLAFEAVRRRRPHWPAGDE